MAANESETVGERETDSQKIDRLIALFQEQGKERRGLTASLDKLAVYLAITAFFFGMGTFADVRKRFAPTRSEHAKSAFVESLDRECWSVHTFPSLVSARTYAQVAYDDLQILNSRRQLDRAWESEPLTGMAPQDVAAYRSIGLIYLAGNDLLQAAANSAQKGDLEGYARDAGLYLEVNASFVQSASNYGFTGCNYNWPIINPLAPSR